ncbi:MAG: Fis family transcriptional regulator [Myxococcales bacterium]|nr:Fis family transcriptional regulator [Myxococcales bacterium]
MAYIVHHQGENLTRSALFKNLTRVGSDSDADLCLIGDGVAQDHAHIMREQDGYYIGSLGRGRSVVLNGKKVKRGLLRNGDRIELGESVLTFYDQELPQSDDDPNQTNVVAYREIVQFSEKLLAQNKLEALLENLLDNLIMLSKADKGFLVLFEDEEPKIRAARNLDHENVDGYVDELSDTIIKKVLQDKEPVIVTNALTDQEFKDSVSIVNLKLCSVMCVPLQTNNDFLGLFYLGSNRVINLFEPELLDAVSVFAAQASLLLQNALLLNKLRVDNDALREALEKKRAGAIIGTCESMQKVFKQISKVAPTDVSVLITGETGTGKELVARELHRESDRQDQPFVVINCGAIPENLLESELFGHVKGAFTGAVQDRNGSFQSAHGGTLFLDEIGEIPLSLQVKLLRALQEKTVTKVGSNESEVVDIRILAATHRNLKEEIQAGNFREDLYYRLNVVCIELPPLRARGDDILLLARYYLQRFTQEYKSNVKGFSPQCIRYMKKSSWPGNIRQLENHIKKAIIMTENIHLSPDDLELEEHELDTILPLAQTKENFQRQYINEILAKNHGNRTKTAKDLAVDPRTIFRHLEREEEAGNE